MHMVIPVSRQNYIRFLSFLEDSPGYTMNDMFEIMLDCYEKHQDSDYPLENQKEDDL
jgi:hypothetical protein